MLHNLANKWKDSFNPLNTLNNVGFQDASPLPFRRYARHETLEKDHCVAVYVRPPKPDAYILKIYAKHAQSELAFAPDASETADNQ
ncbi:unnamed protein product [Dibothriocephalus latus]|uniref:Uncharacterized protein n=1 Tax=Dibothriocephalus latus TaxID=60516 RepID=A0A3P6R4R7_DIBLA|nr:unnamed protein product [Dibothriocephalus latus]